MSTNQQKNTEEEVDLGSIFLIIGKGFSNFFNFIGKIFKAIFHGLITTLIFLKKNGVKITIATIIGAGLGIFMELKTNKKFGSDLLVKPNFESASQLYNNINFYNELVKQKDTLELQKTFNLDKESAASLKKFTIEPIKNETDIINSYDEFVLLVDTTTVRNYSFKQFKASFTDLDYKVHKITVIAEKNDVFQKLDDVILADVIENSFFERVKNLTYQNLNRTDSLLKRNLTQLDSLRMVYMKAMLEESKKEFSGTSIDLAGERRTTKELELFETKRKINLDLEELVKDRTEKHEIINVISYFHTKGYEVKGVTKNYIFLLGSMGALFMVIVLLLTQLNTYLSNYKK